MSGENKSMSNEFLRARFKYEGPAVDDGTMDAQKLGKAILSLDAFFKKFCRKKKEWADMEPQLKIKADRGSFTITAIIFALAYAADKLGVTELSRSFFNEVGKQMALKKFAKNAELKQDGRPIIENSEMYIFLINTEGERRKFDAETVENFRSKIFNKDLELIIDPIEPKKIEKLNYQVFKGQEIEMIEEININDKEYFGGEEPPVLELDLEEDFDENIAEDIPVMTGRLVTYSALANKYPFQFQPREKQDLYGKRFIPCMIADDNKRDDYIELMKSYIGNVMISGRGIKDETGLYRKIKITSVKKNEPPKLFD